jgi:Zn-dependent peptidase ImmA (M78 family)
MFTIAHELAHIWFGKNGVSNITPKDKPTIDEEMLCNKVAAEFLVSAIELEQLWKTINKKEDVYLQIAKHFKVSPIVAARRCLDLSLIAKKSFFEFYDLYMNQEFTKNKMKKGGGDFWNTQNVRIGKRFGQTVVIAAKEGKLSYRDAYRLTNLNGSTFETYSKSIGLPIL